MAKKKPDGELSERDKKFADEYLVDLNGTLAYQRVNPDATDGTAAVEASRRLRKPKVVEYLNKKRALFEKKHDITLDKIIFELAKIGFANMDDYSRKNGDGDPVIDLSNADRDKMAAVSELTIDRYEEGHGDDARPVKKIKFRLHDKRAALVDLGKHFGLGAGKGDEGETNKIEVEGGLPAKPQ